MQKNENRTYIEVYVGILSTKVLCGFSNNKLKQRRIIMTGINAEEY